MNNKGADQTARMRRLVCACVVCKPLKTGFLALRPIFFMSSVVQLVYQHLHDLASQAGFYGNVVECLIAAPAAVV